MLKFNKTDVQGFENAIYGMREPMQSFDRYDSKGGLFSGSSNDSFNDFKDYARAYVIGLGYSDPNEVSSKTRYYMKNGILDRCVDAYQYFFLGKNDVDLAQRLLSTGSDSDGKFLRQISVSVEITAPTYFLNELSTYKVSTVCNSSSLQHKGASRDYTFNDFAIDRYDAETIKNLGGDFAITYTEVGDALNNLLKVINGLRKKYKETKGYKYFRLMRELMPMSYNYTIMWSANYAVLRNIYRQRKNHRLKEWNTDFCNWIKSLPYADDLILYGIDK